MKSKFILPILCLLLTGCDFMFQLHPALEVMDVSYDYGFCVENKATLLLGGCDFFFDMSRYCDVPVIGGDRFEIAYMGHMEIMTSYPGMVNTDRIKIVHVNHVKSYVIESSVSYVNGELVLIPTDSKYENLSVDLDKYVIHEDNSFEKVSVLEEGANVFVSSKDFLTVEALFSFKPR
jgi:hypothetical protein